MQADWFHQFILGGAYRELRDGDRSGAQDILGLFSLPSVRRLGGSRRWAPIRFAFGILARTPTVAASPLLRWADRLGPGRPWHQ
jgi:hypothetical protein